MRTFNKDQIILNKHSIIVTGRLFVHNFERSFLRKFWEYCLLGTGNLAKINYKKKMLNCFNSFCYQPVWSTTRPHPHLCVKNDHVYTHFFEFTVLFLRHNLLHGVSHSYTEWTWLDSLQRHIGAQRKPLIDHLAPLQLA